MGYNRKWKPSKTKMREFAKQMDDISQFCIDNNISCSSTKDSYYFTIKGQRYRVSNHTVASSNHGAYDDFGNQIREKYHNEEELSNTICITASKTRIKEIYTDLKNGYTLDKRGKRTL